MAKQTASSGYVSLYRETSPSYFQLQLEDKQL